MLKRVLLFSVFLIVNFFYAQKIVRFSDRKLYDSIMIIDNNTEKYLNSDELKKYNFSGNSKVLYANELLDFSIDNDTLTFFDKIKEIEEVNVVGYKRNKVNIKELKNKKDKGSITSLVANCKTAFLVKFDNSDKTFIKSINLILYHLNFKYDLGSLKIQILQNNNDIPDNSASIMEFERNISDFSLKFNNYQLAKMQIELPTKLKYPKNGFFIVLEYIAPNSEYMLLVGNKVNFYWFYYPKEKIWKHTQLPEFYYTLDIIK